MSRTVLIIGLFVAAMAHWIFLLPSDRKQGTDELIESARVAMREIAQEMLPSSPNPPKEDPSIETEPTPEPVQPDAAPPMAQAPEATAQPAPEPAPNLSRTAESRRTELDRRGDFSGDRSGVRRPDLRIDWGQPDQARSIVRAGEMRLVMLTSTGGIAGEIQPDDDGWQRVDTRAPDLSGYSNRVRIVDSTMAFAQASSLCNNGERLAVLLPLTLEHKLRTQQIRVATEAGVDSSGILAFYGRFRIDGGTVAFDISGFERRTS